MGSKAFLKKFAFVAIIVCCLCNTNSTFANEGSNEWNLLLNQTIGDIDNEKIYQRFSKGQCTWYAWGRFREIHKKKIRFHGKLGLDAKLWPDLIVNCKVDDKLAEKSIAVSQQGNYGHLIFIEHIEDNTVYYTESNGDGNSIYNRGVDCVLKKTDIESEFLKNFNQYIHP